MDRQAPGQAPEGFAGLVTFALERDGVFTNTDASRWGVSPDALSRAVRTGKVVRLLPRVYAVKGTESGWWAQARAATAWSAGALSHLAAAFAHGLIEEPPPFIEVVSATAKKAPAGSGLRCHQSALVGPPHVTTVKEIAVTAPARTLLDIASRVSEEVLELALEDGLRRGLVGTARLEWQLRTEGRKGRNGTAALKKLLDARAQLPATESALETKVARWFRSTSLPPPVRQHRVFEAGRFVARIDFAYPEARVAIEATSYRWHSGRRAWLRDEERRKGLRRVGWTVIEVTQDDIVHRGPQIEAEIAAALGITLL